MRKTEIEAGVVYAFQSRKDTFYSRSRPGAALLLDAGTLYQVLRYGQGDLEVAPAGARAKLGGMYGSGGPKTGYLAIFGKAEVLERTDWRALYAVWRKLGENGLYPQSERVPGFSDVRVRLLTNLGHLRGMYSEFVAEWDEEDRILKAREREAQQRAQSLLERGKRAEATLQEYGLASASASYRGDAITLNLADAERLADDLRGRTIVPTRE